MAESLGEAVLELRTDDTSFSSGISSAEKRAIGFAGAVAAAAAAASAVLVAVGVASVRMAAEFESSFAGVRKTVDATEAEFDELSSGLRDLALQIPINVNELNSIAEAAGQLGIQKEFILGFTETMANLGVATNLTAEQAATSMARIANVTGLPQGQFDRLGSTVVELGNNFATTESEIIEFGTRIAGAGEIAGLTEAQILGIGAAVSSVGVQAEAGGTAIQKVLIGMTRAVAEGGEDLEAFAATAGLTAAEFARAFREDAGVAFADFVAGLGKQGDKAFATLERLGLEDQRLIRTFISLAGSGDLLIEAMETGTKAFAENTALTKEAEERYKTFDSQMVLTQNTIRDLGISIGAELLPQLTDLLSLIREVAANETFKEFLIFTAELVASLGMAIVDFIRGALERLQQDMRTMAEVMFKAFQFIEGLPRIVRLAIPGIQELGFAAGGVATLLLDMSEGLTTTGDKAAELSDESVQLTETLDGLGDSLSDTSSGISGLLAVATQRLSDAGRETADLSDEIKELETGMDTVLPSVESVAAALDSVGDSAEEAADDFVDMGEVMKAVVADVIFNILTALDKGGADIQEKFKEIFGQAGAEAGAAFGQKFGGPIGAAIGEFLGKKVGEAVGSFIGGLFGGGKSDTVKALERWGLEISEELAKAIERMAKMMGNAGAALRQNLGDVIREVGVQGVEDIRKFIRLSAGLLTDLDQGLINSRQAVTALGDSLSELLDAFEDAGGTMAELNQIGDLFVGMMDRVASGQLDAADATALLNESFGQFIDVAIEMGEAGVEAIARVVEAAQAAGVEAEVIADRLRETMTEALEVLAQRAAFLVDQSQKLVAGLLKMFNDAGQLTRREIEFAATAVLQAFAAMVEAGVPLGQIMLELGDAFRLIQERGEELGLVLGEEFARLGEMMEILAQEGLQRVLTRLEGMAAAIQAVGDMGLLTADQLDAFGDRTDRAFKKLVKGGLTGQEALAALAPQLQLLNDLAEQYGIEIDANTQALIDEAKELGLVTEKGLTTEDILVKGFDRILVVLNALLEALGGVPILFDDMGAAAEDAADDVVEATNAMEKGLIDVGDTGQQVMNQLVRDAEQAAGRMERTFGNIEFGGGGGAPLQALHGTGGFVDFGAGTPAMLHGREQIITAREGESVAAMVASAISGVGADASDDDSNQNLVEIREEITGLRSDIQMIQRGRRTASERPRTWLN